MKNTTLLLILLVYVLFSACESKTPGSLAFEDISGDEFVPGYAILLATSTENTGIIKLNTSKKSNMKGVLYKYSDDNRFNVYEDIEFKLRSVNGIQEAYDVRLIESEANTEIADRYSEEISMNLHNAVITGFEHPEKMIHKWGHFTEDIQNLNLEEGESDTPPKTIKFGNSTYERIRLCEKINDEETSCDYYYIKNSDLQSIPPAGVNFFYNSIPVEIEGKIRNILINFMNQHVHFGDREPYEGR